MSILSIRNLHKTYGRITAVNHLTLEVEPGSVFGLLGPNGSGKTTTLGMILGVTIPTNGEYRWFEEAPNHHQRKRIGAILEKPNFYPFFSAYKNLQIACKIKEVPEKRIDEVLEQVGLADRKNDAFKTYSLGMKQRLAIGSALLGHPEVLILDEPTNGLDPEGIAEIRALISSIAQSDKTIILASHLLDEVQKVCTDFAVLNRGNLIHVGKVDADVSNEVRIEIAAENRSELLIAVRQFPSYKSHHTNKYGLELICHSATKADVLNKFLSERGIYPYHLRVVKKTLEQQFMDILTNNNA